MNEFFKKPVVKILMLKGEKGDKGNTGTGTPKGGKTGQYLLKKSNADYDYVWSPITTVSWDNVSGKTNATENASGLMSAEDKSKLDNLQVGGRNILKGTKDFSGFTLVGSQKVLDSDGFYYCNVINTWSSYFYQYLDKNTLHLDTPYIISFYAKTDKADGNAYFEIKEDSNDYILYTTHINFAEWKKYSGVITFASSKTSVSPGLKFVSRQSTTQVYVKAIKLELGTMPTDWTPAPEDVDSKIDGVDSKIDALKSVTKSFTLSASSWSSGSYTISDSLITATSNQEILPATSITADQMKALQKANIIDSGQSAGSLTLKALGTVPTIDIPIRVIFRGTI